MARTNLHKKNDARTHGGAPAVPALKPELALRRSVLSCLLWENEFYESGELISDRIKALAEAVKVEHLSLLAIEARTSFNLRHVPLLLTVILMKRASGNADGLVAATIGAVVQRADELAELVSIYQKINGKEATFPAAMRRGLALALRKFDEYQLAKYDRAGEVKLRDVLRIAHPVPETDAQRALWGRVIKGELKTPDTWEVELSAGKDKKVTFERLISEGKLGYLALLRNLRGMLLAGVDRKILKDAIVARKGGANRVLPFRFIAAAKAAPGLEDAIDEAFLANLKAMPKLPGRTLVVIDVSGSMQSRLSAKSDMTRQDAASALGAICREICSDAAIYATAGSDGRRTHKTAEVPPRHGMPLAEAISAMCAPLGGGGIFLKQVCDWLAEREKTADRMIVITDEQDCGLPGRDSPLDAQPLGAKHNYLINVASAKNGIGYGRWTHIDGFSESVLRFIHESESENLNLQ